MFKFLKDKLKKAVEKLTKGTEKEVKEEPVKKPVKEEPVKVEKPKRPETKKVEKPKIVKEKKVIETQKPVKAQKSTDETVIIHRLEDQEPPEKPILEIKEKKPEKDPLTQELEDKQQEFELAFTPPEPPAEMKKTGFFKKLFRKDDDLEKPEKPMISIKKEEEEVKPEEPEVTPEEVTEVPELIEVKKEPITLPKEEPEELELPEIEPEKKGFISKLKEKVTTVKLSQEKFEELFWELEMALMENNVAIEVIEKIKEDLKLELTTGRQSRKNLQELVNDTLKQSISELFVEGRDLLKEIKDKKDKPYIIAFIGVNGSGKTTTMAKVAKMLQDNKLNVVFAASDTFRAAAIQQLQEHADRLGVKMIKQDYHSDPAAVAFDAIKHAKSKKKDVVLIDTAGRLHNNDDLMNELKKLIKVSSPDMKIFIGESITGNDCVEQAKIFDEEVGIDSIILAKADVDEKGGAAISISYVTKRPILFLGNGQGYKDLVPFKPEIITNNIGL